MVEQVIRRTADNRKRSSLPCYLGMPFSARLLISISLLLAFAMFGSLTISPSTACASNENASLAASSNMVNAQAYPNYRAASDAVSRLPIITKTMRVSKVSYKTVRLEWESAPDASGYLIERYGPSYTTSNGTTVLGWSTIERIEDAAASSTTVDAPWDVEYRYAVVPFVVYNDMDVTNLEVDLLEASEGSRFTLSPDISLNSAKKVGSKSVKLAWSADEGCGTFEVWRSSSSDSGYKKIGTASSTSFIDKKAHFSSVAYYKVSAAYPDRGKAESGSRAVVMSNQKKAKSKPASWANKDLEGVYYYVKGSRLCVVCHYAKYLKVVELNKNLKKVTSRKVKLPKHDVWGGFYHGPDGNNYVIVGFYNGKESKSKTVIKVFKYSSKWKRGASASIKGSASNKFKGITSPFTDSRAACDMIGSKLYIYTARSMFAQTDGIAHQSDIGFSVDTTTMTAKVENYVYQSHSFAQLVKFKDGDIFLVGRGDAYPQVGILLSVGSRYGADSMEINQYVPFKGMGYDVEIGGVIPNSMAVSSTMVLISGIAQPNYYPVKGVKGWRSNLRHNVFLTVTDKETGKSSVKWLTKIHPKKGKSTVGATSIVQVGENRFDVIYQVKSDKTSKTRTYCKTVDGSGKVLKTRKYSNARYSDNIWRNQPIVFNGALCWLDMSDEARMYSIPM